MATRWGLFAGVTLILVFVVLGLSRATTREMTAGDRQSDPPVDGVGVPTPEQGVRISGEEPPEVAQRPPTRASGEELLLSAALSQGLVGCALASLALYAEVPAGALGVDDPTVAVLPGVALGVGLYAANEAGGRLAGRVGVDSDESLRKLLAPETTGGWLLLLGVVLPLVAVVEELLFRAALVGALAAGFPVSPWLLAALSSVAFGLGHGLQGPAGVVVTGVLGFVLAGAFILTGSLWVVVVAHYLLNALEFLLHEGV